MQTLLPLDDVAVVGPSGFIGVHVVRALQELGCHPILLMRSPGATNSFGKELRTFRFDLTDGASIREALASAKPRIVLNLGGTRVGRDGQMHAARICAEVNVAGTLRLLEAVQECSVERVVILGSAAEYGDQSGPLSEDLPLRPTSPYGISKAAATQFAQALHRAGRCPVVILRLFSVYGPGQPADMFVAEAILRAVESEEFQMSEGKQRRDLVYIHDVVRAIIAAARASDVEGRVINVGSGQGVSLKTVADLIWRFSGTQAPLRVGARPAAPTELHDTWADVTLARRLLNWQVSTDLETGLRATLDWARARYGRTPSKAM